MNYDAIVIGGSFAGLSAALQLARARRTVCIVDAGQPRNRFAAHSHGLFGHDGANPAAVIEQARNQVLTYPTVTLINGEAITTRREETANFSVGLASGEMLSGSGIVLAHGVQDFLPEIPGIRERWGVSVLHCPYCHGYEYGGQQLGVLRTMPGSVHQAMLISEWGPLTYFLNGVDDLSEADRAELLRRNITIELAPVAELIGTGQSLSGIRIENDRVAPIDALFLAPNTRLNGLAEQLDCVLEEGPTGPYIRTDSTKMTTTPGVFAAGDIATPMWNATFASADGVMAGVALHRSLVFGSTD